MGQGKETTSGKKVGLITLGCAKNRVDSEVMLGRLRASGHEVVDSLDRAETVIVNTCGFVEDARRESIDTILEVAQAKTSGVEKLLVAGCMVNRYGTELAEEIPEIDGFIGLDDLAATDRVVQIGSSRAPTPGPSHLVFDHQQPRVLTTRGYAYLKVAEGCNNPCTFCAIPQWRGQFRSRTLDSLVQEAQFLEEAGIQELCLVAQDTTRYGEDLGLGRHGLLRLVEALLEATDIPWVRFLYAYPTTLDRDLLRLMGAESRVVSYLDIPLQHSHPEVLRRMRRGGSRRSYVELVEQARVLAPEISLRTTFIVGFPGESEEHFEDLVDFVETTRFDHLGVFLYSPEEGTPSADELDQVDIEVARKRRATLLEAQRPISLAARQGFVGQRIEVLVEGVCRETEHLLEGRHQGMAPDVDGRVLINDGVVAAGTLAQVEVTDAFADDLVGRVVEAGEGVGTGADPTRVVAHSAASE